MVVPVLVARGRIVDDDEEAAVLWLLVVAAIWCWRRALRWT